MTAKGQIRKSPGPRPVKLEPLESEIMELHLQGKKTTEIRNWLKAEKGITTAYSNLHAFIHRRTEKYSATSGTSVILHFMRLKPEVREEVLQILLMLMHKNLPNQRSVKKESPTAPQQKVYIVPTDFLTIRPDDSPGLKRLKRLASLDSTQLENLLEELRQKQKW